MAKNSDKKPDAKPKMDPLRAKRFIWKPGDVTIVKKGKRGKADRQA